MILMQFNVIIYLQEKILKEISCRKSSRYILYFANIIKTMNQETIPVIIFSVTWENSFNSNMIRFII